MKTYSCKKCDDCDVFEEDGLCEMCQREEDTLNAIDELEADLKAAAEKYGYSVKELWIAGTRSRQFELFLEIGEECDCFTVRLSDRRAVSRGQTYSILTDMSKADGFEFSLNHVAKRMERNAAKKLEIGGAA